MIFCFCYLYFSANISFAWLSEKSEIVPEFPQLVISNELWTQNRISDVSEKIGDFQTALQNAIWELQELCQWNLLSPLPGGWSCGNVRTATPEKKLLKKHIRGFSPGSRYFPEISKHLSAPGAEKKWYASNSIIDKDWNWTILKNLSTLSAKQQDAWFLISKPHGRSSKKICAKLLPWNI